ncbi:MAG: aspartate-semialdehyde dehydrogenase [Clostridia bacterium]|nr:aspartate-semialdehyde dehydrogenase [Clostridia bacterium]
MRRIRIAVVGASGMVGRMFLRVLQERNIEADYVLLASKRSAGGRIEFFGKEYVIEELTTDSFKNNRFDLALFSAGGSVSLTYAPLAAEAGAIVIDNSSAWRMDEAVPLIVPEVNPQALDGYKNKGIIANPNCSTIQAMLPLKALSNRFGLKRVVYSTYQAVSGAGMQGCLDLSDGLKGEKPKKFPHPIAGNCIPHIDVYLPNGYFKEEQKMIDETRKILDLPTLPVTATAVRVPVYHGHSVSINAELCSPFEMEEVLEAFRRIEGLVIEDDPKNNVYPMPVKAAGTDFVYVGRIRRDFSVESGLNLWCVADNVRKGAATNAVQIAELLIKKWEEEK